MGKLLGVSWCLPCLTIAKNSGGLPHTKSLNASNVNKTEKGMKNKLFDIPANGSHITNMIPPCTTLLDTTFHASNTLFKLALLQKRSSSEKPIKVSELCSNLDTNSDSKTAISLFNDLHNSKNPLNISEKEIVSQSTRSHDSSSTPSPLNKRSQSDMNIDEIVQECSHPLKHYKSLNSTDHDECSSKSNAHPLIKSQSSSGQKSTAIVRPCLRHRRSSYDDILGQSSKRRTNRYSSLDNKCIDFKTSFKSNSMVPSYDTHSSTQPLNKSVKFVLPESSEQESKNQNLTSTMTPNFYPHFASDQNISSPFIPWSGLSPLPYNCVVNHQANCYSTLSSNSSVFPYAGYIPSIDKPSNHYNGRESFISLDNSFPKINLSFPSNSCDMNYINTSLQLASSNFANQKDIPLLGVQKECKPSITMERNTPTTLYWASGCIYDPTVYFTTLSAPSNVCSTCYWIYNENGKPTSTFPDKISSQNHPTGLSNSIASFHDKIPKAEFKNISNSKCSLIEPDNFANTDSEDDSTEGD